MTANRPDRQLVFDLAQTPSYAPDEFLVASCNEIAHAALASWPAWPDRVLLLLGPAGSGKSHLAAMWAAQRGAVRLGSEQALGDMLACGAASTAVVDDCDRLHLPESGLFHLLNVVRDGGGWLLMTARQAPDWWGLTTPDLVSRLRLAPSVLIGTPDAHLIRAVVVKLFADRQIDVDEDVVNYAARHCDRSLDAVRRFVAAVDEAALSAGRRITRALAKATLDKLRDGPDDATDQGPT